MPQFQYRAKKGPEQLVDGVVEADNIDGAVAYILQLGYTPIDVKSGQSRDSAARLKSLHILPAGAKKIPPLEVTWFTRYLCDLIDAGVPVLRSLFLVRNQIKHPYFKNILGQIYSAVKDGVPLSSALARFPDIFSVFYVNIIKSGEVSGNLGPVLNRLADFLEKDQEIQAQVTSSLVYPSLIIFVGFAAVTFLLTWVIPQITSIFEDMGENLPLPTVILMTVSGAISRYWWIGLVLAGSGFIYLRNVCGTPHGRLWFDGIKLRILYFGDFIKGVEIGHFSRTLATLLDNGVTIIVALESIVLVIRNEVLRKEIRKVLQDVTGGSGLAVAMGKSSFFPESVVHMVAVGEESGEIYKGLYKVALYYERQSQRAIKTMTSLIEPGLILFLGIVIGFVVVAMLMPIFRMNMIVK